MKIMTVVGARPQFIKAAAVSRFLRQQGLHSETLVHTGQHYDENMSEIFFQELDIPRPAHDLGVRSGRHGEQTGKMLQGLEELMITTPPDCVLVYGDTNSTLAAALAASKLHIPLLHVEAGLRSFNRKMPEEINRIVTDHLSQLLFTPSEIANRNLKNEGIDERKIFQVGDVMFDSALYFGEQAKNRSGIVKNLKLEPKKYILATIHRAENTDNFERLGNIFQALQRIAQKIRVICPIHPRTTATVRREKRESWLQGLDVIDPVGYLDMVELERNAACIVTDSGGVQKEAFFYRVPCVTLRDETEWLELVQNGWNRVVPPMSVESMVTQIFDAVGSIGNDLPLYGDGTAAQKIIQALERL